MQIAIVTFDGFTDIDVVLPWDLLHRATGEDWTIRLLGTAPAHVSATGLTLPMHGVVEETRHADVVLFASGRPTRALAASPDYLARFDLDPRRQMIGSMCSGALVLAALGLLRGAEATTYPTAKAELEAFGVTVVEQPFVANGNVATAAGCLAAQDLVGWVVERLLGPARRDLVLRSIQPVGRGLELADADALGAVYAPATAR